jgi:hypothetical protein
MSPQELFQSYLSGKELGTISLAAARRLLDQARSALLTVGRTLKNATAGTTAEAKQAILEAHRELQRAGIAEGNAPVYNSAGPQETRTIEEAEQCLAMLKAINATPRKSSNRITATATRPSVRPATTATTRPTPARVPAPAPSRPTPPAKAAATPTVNPLADYSLSKLGWLATHRSAPEADRQTARAELTRRGATITASGIVSQSTRRQAK